MPIKILTLAFTVLCFLYLPSLSFAPQERWYSSYLPRHAFPDHPRRHLPGQSRVSAGPAVWNAASPFRFRAGSCGRWAGAAQPGLLPARRRHVAAAGLAGRAGGTGRSGVAARGALARSRVLLGGGGVPKCALQKCGGYGVSSRNDCCRLNLSAW